MSNSKTRALLVADGALAALNMFDGFDGWWDGIGAEGQDSVRHFLAGALIPHLPPTPVAEQLGHPVFVLEPETWRLFPDSPWEVQLLSPDFEPGYNLVLDLRPAGEQKQPDVPGRERYLPPEPAHDKVIEARGAEGGMITAWKDADGRDWKAFAGTRNRLLAEDWANIVEAALRHRWRLYVCEKG